MRRFWPIPSSHRHDKTYNFPASFKTGLRQSTRDQIREQGVRGNNDISTGNQNLNEHPCPLKEEQLQST